MWVWVSVGLFWKGMAKTISFAEIVRGCDASVRVTDDMLIYAVDLAMVVTGKDRDYAAQVEEMGKSYSAFAVYFAL